MKKVVQHPSSRTAGKEIKAATLSTRVNEQIRALILNGELQPGERIGQEALAERFGTSRIPVREALRQLESEGLVIMIPNSSARVAKLDIDECSEIYKIRELIEPLALAEAIPRMTEDDITDLEQAIREIEDTEDSDVFLKLDREFHLASYRAAGMPRLKALVESYWNTTQHYRRAYTKLVWQKGNWIINYEHRLLLEAIKRRDPVDASQILKMHIRRTHQELLRREELFGEPAAERRRKRNRTE